MSTDSTEQIEEQAAEWLVRRDSPEWKSADEQELQRWLEESVAHSVAFIRLEVGWEQARRLKALGNGVSGVVPPPGQWQVSPFFDPAPPEHPPEWTVTSTTDVKIRKRGFAAAAALLVAVVSGTYFLQSPGDRYKTELGVVSAVPMSDGSRVTLNTASEIRVAVSDTERKVELKQGEAFFEVAKDPNRPFVVEAGSKRIVAIGTAFSVRWLEKDVEVVVTEGEVRVESAGQELKVAATRVESLTAGKVARANAEGLLVEKKPLADLQELLAWRAGYLVFNETPLADAVAEFNRYNAEKIVIEDPVVAGYRVSGKFRSTSFGAFVRLLETAFPIEVRQRDAQIRLSARDGMSRERH